MDWQTDAQPKKPCSYKLSTYCDGTIMPRKTNVMCTYCWKVAKDEEKESTKKEYGGYYCCAFKCFETSPRWGGFCVKHAEKETEKEDTKQHGGEGNAATAAGVAAPAAGPMDQQAILALVEQVAATRREMSALRDMFPVLTARVASLESWGSRW